jgi:phosphatidylinositol alpha 1,6-mannosyltransferase
MEDKIRILFSTECYPPFIAGSGIAIKGIATGLANLGHKIAIICPSENIRNEITQESGVTVYRLKSIPVPSTLQNGIRFSLFPKKQVNRIFKEFNPEILHITDHFFISGAAYSLAKKSKIPVIGTNHFTPYNFIENFVKRKKSPIYIIAEKAMWHSMMKIYNNLEMVTVPSEYAKKITQKAGLKIPVIVISNGIRLEEYEDKSINSGIAVKYKIDKNKTILLSASRLDREKRVGVILNACSLIKDKVEFQLLITGKGKDRKNLEAIALKNGISEKVIFTGVVSQSELKDLYKISDIFLTASEVELQGLSIMEAMASGLPVIASNSMAIPELVKDDISGFLFEPGNGADAGEKILKLANDKILREKMSLSGLENISNHDINIILARLEGIYRALMNNTGS